MRVTAYHSRNPEAGNVPMADATDLSGHYVVEYPVTHTFLEQVFQIQQSGLVYSVKGSMDKLRMHTNRG